MQAALIDCHTHTFFSDGESSFEENLQAAANQGCKVLVSSDHLTLPASMDPNQECQVPYSKLEEHRCSFKQAKEQAKSFAPNVEFVFGFECDWYPGCEKNIDDWARKAQVKLGSVHWIGDAGTGNEIEIAAGEPGSKNVAPADAPLTGNGWIDYSQDLHVWDELGPDEVWRKYVGAWCAACESPANFDIMSHPDLPMRFYKTYAPPANLSHLWSQMAECARYTNCRIEISSASFRAGLCDFYPAKGLLENFFRAGVKITFGSDAHNARFICDGIRKAQKHAWEIGYRRFDVPRADGSWESWEL